MEADLTIRFGLRLNYSFVQGEDRQMELTLYDRAQGGVLDLSGSQVTLRLPREGGGTLRRSSAPVAVTAAQVVVATAPGVLAVPDHGLATGDVFTVAAMTLGSLPGGLATSTQYKAKVLDDDSFSVQTLAGADVVLSTIGAVGFNVTLADAVVLGGAGGKATFTLPAALTAAASSGQGQNIQVDVVTASGKRRVAIGYGALDVFAPIE